MHYFIFTAKKPQKNANNNKSTVSGGGVSNNKVSKIKTETYKPAQNGTLTNGHLKEKDVEKNGDITPPLSKQNGHHTNDIIENNVTHLKNGTTSYAAAAAKSCTISQKAAQKGMIISRYINQ